MDAITTTTIADVARPAVGSEDRATDTPSLPGLTVLDAATVRRCIEADRPACLDAVRDAYAAHHAGVTVNPPSSFLRFPGRERERIIALPAHLGDARPTSGIKWISSFPANTDRGLPRASAVLVLNDEATGYPSAVLEASLVSATRTAASAVLGAELLVGERRARRVGFVGTGLIADHVLAFLHETGWEVGELVLCDTDRSHAERFSQRASRRLPDAAVVIADAEETVRTCDLLVVTTVASTPHILEPAWFEHNPVVLHLSLRDLGPDVIRSAFNVTDDVDHAVREGTSLQLAAVDQPDLRFIAGTVGDLLDGSLQRDPSRPAVFSPFGLGVLDLAVGRWVHDTVDPTDGTRLDGFYTGLTEAS